MKTLSIIFTLFLALNSFGSTRFGSKCGLTNAKDESWTRTKSFNISSWSDARITGLPTLTKQQIIIAAKDLTKGPDGLVADIEIKTTIDAVNVLRGNSEGGDVYVMYYKVNRLDVTEVLHYPGGNPVGIIFKTGWKRIHAENGDDTITCR